jgi:hypothetical protein
MSNSDTRISIFAERRDRVEWAGSRLAAPGPGARQDDDTWSLLGTVMDVSSVDPNSIKVKWDNGRITFERKANLKELT